MNNPFRSKLNRRAFLYGAGSAGLALPFLEGLPERSAFGQNQDPRFAFFACAMHGVVADRFWPSQLGELTTAGMQAESDERCTGLLAEHAHRLLMVRGITSNAGSTGESHERGLIAALTGLPPGEGSSPNRPNTGPSADWEIARAWGEQPLALFAGLFESYVGYRLSFSAAGQLTEPERDPYQLYLRLTGLLDESTGQANLAAQELMAQRKSANDLVREELQSLLARPELSVADRQRLDLHFSSIRDIELEMEEGCGVQGLDPSELQAIDPDGFVEDIARLHMHLVGIAFSCNLFHSASLQWGSGIDHTRYVIDGETLEYFHYISHRIHSDGASGSPIENAEAKHAAIDRVRMGTFKTALDRWSELSTPRGDLLDSAMAMWITDIADGPTASTMNIPVVIAGSLGGQLKQGVYLQADESSSNGVLNGRLLSTLIEACGGDASQFADQLGGLPSILA